MENVIIILCMLWLCFIIIYHIKADKPQRKKQNPICEYEKKRYLYYARERKKIMQHYKKQVLDGNMSIEDALHDSVKLMAFNSGGYKNWKDEFRKFKQEIKTYHNKK